MNRNLAVALLLFGLTLHYALAVPVITSFSPEYQAATDPNSVQILGSGFTGGTLIVKFNGVQATTAQATGPNTIVAKVPANAPLGPGPIYVKVGNDETYSSSNFVVISSGPYIHGFSPAGGNAGTQVTITGAHFNTGGSPTIRFGSIIATGGAVSEKEIIINAPAGVTTSLISVTRGTSYTNQTPFYVNPVITGFSPTVGRAGTNVTIRGTNFTGTISVKFGNTTATDFFATNNNVIDVLVPVGASTGTIRIDTPALNPAITSSNFIVQPTISGFSPNFGQSGTAVTVTGANLNVGTPAVRFGTALSANVSNITFSNLVAVVPPGAVTAAITISNAHGTNMSSQLFYMPPRIDSFTPSNAPAGTRIKIVGTNLLGTSAISFNGTPAPEFTVTNNGVIGVDVPAGAISGPIFITTPHSTTNSGINWFFATPVITGFNPSHGLPGTNVTILGTNFAGVSSVQFNGSNAAFNLGTNGVLTAIVPTNATTGFVSVTTPAGTATSGVPFTLDYASDLRVTVSAPASAVLGSDYTYVIAVTNLGPAAAANVMFTNQLPGNVAYKFGSTSKGGPVIASGGTVRVALGTLNAGTKATITLTVTAQGTGTAENIARAFGNDPDPNPADNTVTTNTLLYVVPLLGMQQLSETQLRLSWSVALADFILESTGNLALTSSWLEVLTEPEYIGDQKTVTETIGPESRFYRLRRN